MILYDFFCSKCERKFEAFAKLGESKTICSRCGGEAERLVSAPRIRLDGCDSAFPTAYDQWAKRRGKEVERARKHEREHGEELYK